VIRFVFATVRRARSPSNCGSEALSLLVGKGQRASWLLIARTTEPLQFVLSRYRSFLLLMPVRRLG